MAAVSEVPDVTRQEVTIRAGMASLLKESVLALKTPF